MFPSCWLLVKLDGLRLAPRAAPRPPPPPPPPPGPAAAGGRRRGTSVTVEALFYNTPARQKFLRGARSEWRAIVEVLTTMTLARPDVRLTASHDGRETLALPPAASLSERVAALWGARAPPAPPARA